MKLEVEKIQTACKWKQQTPNCFKFNDWVTSFISDYNLALKCEDYCTSLYYQCLSGNRKIGKTWIIFLFE